MPIDFSVLEALGFVEALRFSRWGYAAVNATHIFGICLLVGGALPMTLRLFGIWSDTRRDDVVRILSTSAGTGLVITLISGAFLFATRASEYADHPALLIKLVFVSIGTVSSIIAHIRYGWRLQSVAGRAAIQTGIVSAVCWIGALVAGRLIAFIE